MPRRHFRHFLECLHPHSAIRTMPSFPNILLCAFFEALIGLSIGWPVACRLVAWRSLTLALAPILGWVAFNTLALLILSAVGFGQMTVALLAAAAILAGLAALLFWPPRSAGGGPEVQLWAFAAAALLAVVPALAAWPKYAAGGVVLAEAMFDHSKAAIIDDI